MKKRKGLSAWQLTMMALGTVIGGSFFIGSSVAIHAAGPSVIISFILGGALVYFILFALSEMTVANPDVGSFRTFAAQSFGQGVGFVVGWVYWSGMVLAMSSEATAVSILVSKWIPNISFSLLGSLTIISVTLLNLLGADKLSKLESSLAAVKLLAIASFIILALLLIIGMIPGISSIGAGELVREPLMPGGGKGIAGSMLIVMFSYAGFEIIGLAASETENPRKTVPKAITYTVLCLVGFYVISIALLLPLIPTANLSEDLSPMVAALNRWGIGWAGTAINLVLITAILSTMLAAMFGIGRMMRSLANEGLAPKWLKDERDVPYRGILFSGLAMLLGLGLGLLLPRVYLFLISSGGFALLFTYTVIMATHIRFRKRHGCPPEGKCQMPGYPYTSWVVLFSMIVVILSMPFIQGQGSGLVAGLIMTGVYALAYLAIKIIKVSPQRTTLNKRLNKIGYQSRLVEEFSKELIEEITEKDKHRK
ncbi:amino acid permease [Desulfosporosinus sp.]|uniref:amino acid permease n=1 Tax=Desulfosporosinus sp. TaxID=157907 RepID=UPI000E855487|nr:amino acid permease [Desulfosporosinus sp.]MBC2724414.1 amino acid permease [Desulfosporosinus sp.]MBC2725740.1 amino acid permease [Desulfosporosinus sp.]HBV88585.1 amino acid permease [Desulfosporosinus sp.]